MQHKITPNNLHSFCRTCLNELQSSMLNNIHKMDIQIRLWLQDVSIDNCPDPYPKFVCNLCREKLEDILDFRRMCKQSRNSVKKILKYAVQTDLKSEWDEPNSLVEETTESTAVLNEIYEDGDLLEFDCILISNQPDTSNSSYLLENEDTTSNMFEENTKKFEFLLDDQESRAEIYSGDKQISKSKHNAMAYDFENNSNSQGSKCDRAPSRLQDHLNEVETSIYVSCEYEGCDRIFGRSDTYMLHKRFKHKDGEKLKARTDLQDPNIRTNDTYEKVTTERTNLNEHQYCRKPELSEVQDLDMEKVKLDDVVVANETIDDDDLLEFDFIPIATMEPHAETIYSESAENEDSKTTLNIELADSLKYLDEVQQSTNNDKDEDSPRNCSIHIKDEGSAKEESHFVSTTFDTPSVANSISCDRTEKAEKHSETDSLAVARAKHGWKFPCNQCGKLCLSQLTLDNHKRTHRGLKPYECPICKHGFSQLTSMRSHLNEVHAEIKIVCEYEDCNKEFRRSQSYYHHCRNKHGLKAGKKAPHRRLREVSVKLTRLKEHEISGNLKSLKAQEEPEEYAPVDTEDRFDVDLISAAKKFTEIEERSTTCKSQDQQSRENEESKEVLSTNSIHAKDEDHNTEINNRDVQNVTSTTPLKEIKRCRPRASKFQCDLCQKRCLNQQSLDNHKRVHQGLKPSQCPLCERSFHSASYMRTHLKEFHTKINIKCEFEGCGKEFHRTCTYLQHKRHKHMYKGKPKVKAKKPKPTQQHVCEECGRVFGQLYALQVHHYSHRPREEYPFPCPECDKAFPSRERLKRHRIIHSDTKDYECPHCGLKKRNIHELKAHINYHTKELVYRCPKCPRVFNDKVNLNRHNNIHHLKLRPYVCRYCEQRFAVYQTWKHHEMRHTGEKPNACPQCDLRFIQPSALKRHIKRHHSVPKPTPVEQQRIKRKS